jgi:hypothetical protein
MSDENSTRPDPSDFDGLKHPNDYDNLLPVRREVMHIPLRKPLKYDHFRTHPTYEQPAAVLKIPGDKSDDHWLLCGPVMHEVPPYLYTAMTFVPYLTRRRVLGMWPLRMPMAGRTDAWAQSALEICNIAKKAWVQLYANQGAGAYEHAVLTDATDEPEWPSMTWEAMRERAFRTQLIKTLDHPVLLQILKGK